MKKQRFGGDWTEEKLSRVKKYLVAYSTIMNKYPLQYAYIDAFAGTGYRTLNTPDEQGQLMLPELIDPESQQFIEGSAKIALQVKPEFNKYIFVEKDEEKIKELNNLKIEFNHLSDKIEIVHSDANTFLKRKCNQNTNWERHRAVLFLDPFGMQVPWKTIEAIAQTQAIDLWYLFPVGIAINRLLKRDGNISESVRNKLNETFGTTSWWDTFYTISEKTNLFGTYTETEKIADYKLIGRFFIERLKIIFAGVAENPLLLLNSQNTPLYLLCFASANPKGAPTAIKIEQHILKS